MEEKSISEIDIDNSQSDWKLKQNILKNLRNYRQLQNRLLILEIEKQKKVKSIQKKLGQHKKSVDIKIEKFKHQKNIENLQTNFHNEEGSNSRMFRQVRQDRMKNIQKKSEDMRKTKNRLYHQVKKQRETNQQKIEENCKREISTKVQKRNHVRLNEIESKENVINYWTNRIQNFKYNKFSDIKKKLKSQEGNMVRLINLQKCQTKLLEDIKKTEEMETKLTRMMEKEKSMIKEAINISQI